MPKNILFPPEGLCPPDRPNLDQLRQAAGTGLVFEAPVLRCDARHDLHLCLGGVQAVLPRAEVNAPWISGSEREIAVLSKVGKQICFSVTSVQEDGKGQPCVLLSRRAVQEAAMATFLHQFSPGDILTCRVTRPDSFGAFVDIGRGIIAMIPLESASVSRISHANVRFREGQVLPAALLNIDRVRHRITMTHRELLGTWSENAALFSPGETVQGVVRSIREYGSFIELAPNLSGLTDMREGLSPGDRVAVYIKSIQPRRMKIKLNVISRLGRETEPAPLHYMISDGHIDRWTYSPEEDEREPVETVFKASSP